MHNYMDTQQKHGVAELQQQIIILDTDTYMQMETTNGIWNVGQLFQQQVKQEVVVLEQYPTHVRVVNKN